MPVMVRQVLYQDGLATADEYVDGHAANVAQRHDQTRTKN